VIKVTRILKDYQESGALHARVSVHAAIDEHTFLTKSGAVLTILQVLGVDYQCLDPEHMDGLARRFESALRILGPEFRVNQYWLKRDNASIPYRHYANPVLEEAVTNRIAYLKGKAGCLYSLETYFAILYEGCRTNPDQTQKLSQLFKNPQAVWGMLSTEKAITVFEEELTKACAVLTNKVMSFVIQLQDVLPMETLDRQRAYRFLRSLVNYAPYKHENAQLKYDSFVDFQLCDSTLECYRDHLRLDEDYIQVLTLKEPPAQTFAHMLRGLLEIPSNYIIASEWKRESNAKMRSLIQSKRRHFHNAKASMMNYLASSSESAPKDMLIDSSAVAQVSELGGCLEELEVKGHYFGQFSMSLVLYDKDRTKLRRSVADCFKIFSTHDAQLTEESYNLLNAWLAILPGNHAYNLRTLYVLNSNCADLSFLFTQRTGELENRHLGTEYLAVLESEGIRRVSDGCS